MSRLLYVCPANPVVSSTPQANIINSPEGKRKGSAGYWKEKYLQMKDRYYSEHKRSIDLSGTEGALEIKKVLPKSAHTYARVTQVYGSMNKNNVMEKIEALEESKRMKEEKKIQALEKKEKQKQIFLKCVDKCICNTKSCAASNLKQCPNCKNVMKSICSKKACLVDDKKPTMILSAGLKRKTVVNDESDESEYDSDLSNESDGSDNLKTKIINMRSYCKPF